MHQKSHQENLHLIIVIGHMMDMKLQQLKEWAKTCVGLFFALPNYNR